MTDSYVHGNVAAGDCCYNSDRAIFESIKSRVVREFHLGPEYLDVLQSAAARFDGDPDVIMSANYLRYNRATQGCICVGDKVDGGIPLASLDGTVTSLRQLVGADAGDSRPVAIIAGSIT